MNGDCSERLVFYVRKAIKSISPLGALLDIAIDSYVFLLSL